MNNPKKKFAKQVEREMREAKRKRDAQIALNLKRMGITPPGKPKGKDT
jgi:hypothetical protein